MLIKHAILHILNKDNGELIKSDTELSMSSGGIHEYLEKFVTKFLISDFKEGEIGDNEVLQHLVSANDSESFISTSGDLAEDLFNAIATAEEVPSGDLIVVDYSEGAADYLAVFKLNFTRMYSQSIDSSDSGIANSLVLNLNILQPNSQQISDGLLIDKTHGVYYLTEKRYLIDGHRVNVLSTLLGLNPKLSARTQMNYLSRAIKNTADKYDVPAYQALSDAQNYLYENSEFVDSVSIDYVAEKSFPQNEAAQKDLLSSIAKYGIETYIDIPLGSEKKLSKRVFKLDSGIEVSVPAELLRDDNRVEFINNDDGTSSINIKGIDSIKTKFIS